MPWKVAELTLSTQPSLNRIISNPINNPVTFRLIKKREAQPSSIKTEQEIELRRLGFRSQFG